LCSGSEARWPRCVVAILERRLDLYVSTLRRCLEALGGTLEVVAHFPDGSITLTTFGEVDEGSDVP
jgi:hypothetical protein